MSAAGWDKVESYYRHPQLIDIKFIELLESIEISLSMAMPGLLENSERSEHIEWKEMKLDGYRQDIMEVAKYMRSARREQLELLSNKGA